MTSSITQPEISELLQNLYADAAEKDSIAGKAEQETGRHPDEAERYRAARHRYMAVGRDFGNLLYALIRSAKPKTVIEFGTSFGVSTIYLAAAVRDNGEGLVITTEFIAEKSEQAKKNLSAGGLVEWVEFRVGDVKDSLKTDLPEEIDVVFLDGAKGLYLDVLKLLEPRLRTGSLIVSDNTDHAELVDFLQYVRTPSNGYISSAIQTISPKRSNGHEITIRF